MNQNVEITGLLLKNKNIDVNILSKISKSRIDSHLSYGSAYRSNLQQEMNEPEETLKKTALHIAVENNNIEIIKLLLENKNIDVNVKDEKGRKPIQLVNDFRIRSLFS